MTAATTDRRMNNPQCHFRTNHIPKYEPPKSEMISFADAGIQEVAMMIERGNATVAVFAMMGAEGRMVLAGSAVFSTGVGIECEV
mmetsp:Transcript_31635/g.66993  ORF Transcript_31635/g.66993 Transcript_31635/m.66993 type:complete len:85 (-) Transcript_31635:147-401(-)